MKAEFVPTNELYEMKFEELRDKGFIDPMAVRNNTIREKHAQNVAKGLTMIESLEELSQEFFISEDACRRALYSKRRERKPCLTSK